MLDIAESRCKDSSVQLIQGDVSSLPFPDHSFDIVLSMNGFHVFQDKKKAFDEVYRVLRPGGKFLACFYISGQRMISDLLVSCVLARKGWFTPPFDTVDSVKERLKEEYEIESFNLDGSIVYFSALKR